MNNSIPTVSLEETILPPATMENATAVPLFIGALPKSKDCANSNDEGNLEYFQSYNQFEQTYKKKDLFQLAKNDEDKNIIQQLFKLYDAVKLFFDNGGRYCYVYSIIPANDVFSCFKKGKRIDELLINDGIDKALAKSSDITLLSIPDLTAFFEYAPYWRGEWEGNRYRQACFHKAVNTILSSCKKHHCFALLDTIENYPEALSQLDESLSSYGAAWWPYLVTNYKDDRDKNIILPPSAAMAGLICSLDESEGIWKPPANKAFNCVISVTDEGIVDDTLSQYVNIIKSFPGRGVRPWGVKTVYNPEPDSNISPEREYIQMRRLVSHIERKTKEMAQFSVFEMNNEVLWLKVQATIESWLQVLWQQGALRGSKKEEAYQVNVGLGKTMDTDDIKSGNLIVEVALALMHPAEFIKVNIVLQTGI